ncbi:enoyl-CoA hydratase/isomerase family protein [Gammaproteobacteria bacterium]|nr:enoyl-CoA hydratase/isomerase family protein [Gammaproteobacteria bacterium]
MSFETLELIKSNNVATIKLNRPNVLNAFNEQLMWDLQKATSKVGADKEIRVLIITGNGKGFSAGADLGERSASWSSSKDALERGYKPIFQNIINMDKPVIASINGPAAGIGAALALACDLRVMSQNAYIMSVFSNIALVPDGGLSWTLPKFMGYGKAYEYAIEAKKIFSDECLQFGIANKVVLADELEECAENWAINLSKRSPQSLIHTKKLMRKSQSNGYWDIYEFEGDIQTTLTGSSENREAVKAFFEKREPNFD